MDMFIDEIVHWLHNVHIYCAALEHKIYIDYFKKV